LYNLSVLLSIFIKNVHASRQNRQAQNLSAVALAQEDLSAVALAQEDLSAVALAQEEEDENDVLCHPEP